jgi:hypothetical protein
MINLLGEQKLIVKSMGCLIVDETHHDHPVLIKDQLWHSIPAAFLDGLK